MWPRKNKSAKQQGRVRQTRQESRPSAPAFSYYANRPAEPNSQRSVTRQATDIHGVTKPRISFNQLPFWVFLAVLVVCAFKLLMLSPNPKVVVLGQDATTTSYQASPQIYAVAAQKLLASSLTNRTKLTANVDGVASSLERQFPELQTASVTLPLIGNRPIVYVQIAQPSLVLQTAHGNYAVNKAGIVLAKLRSVPSDATTVVDQTGVTPVAGKQLLPSSTVDFVRTVLYQTAAAKLAISTFVLPQTSPYELDMRLEGKAYIIKFNLQADPLQQSGAVTATLAQLGATTPASYLDVRVPERVYYR